jgi:hypothetical protein
MNPRVIEQASLYPLDNPTERRSLMARLASVVKQGYFPAPLEAVAGILRHLKIPDPPPDSQSRAGDINILDPCAGEARALVQIAEGLGVSKGHVFAVELNARRAAVIGDTHPEIRLLGPCSFEATRITRQSLSMVFLNPPFDDEFGGGGREEVTFLRRSVDLLVPGGILVLVCPVGLSRLFAILGFGLLGALGFVLFGLLEGLGFELRNRWFNPADREVLPKALDGGLFGLGIGLIAVVSGLKWGLVAALVGLVVCLIFGPTMGLVVLVAGLFVGGQVWLNHVLPWLSHIRNDLIPWRYVRFLDYAADRVLLRKVGGGYAFLHRMLLEYFAARYVEPSAVDKASPESSSIEVNS